MPENIHEVLTDLEEGVFHRRPRARTSNPSWRFESATSEVGEARYESIRRGLEARSETATPESEEARYESIMSHRMNSTDINDGVISWIKVSNTGEYIRKSVDVELLQVEMNRLIHKVNEQDKYIQLLLKKEDAI